MSNRSRCSHRGALEPIDRHETTRRPLIAPNDKGRYEQLPDHVVDRFPQYSESAQMFKCSKCTRVVGLR
jgi:hypothetical protein